MSECRGDRVLRVVCFLCDGGVPRPFAARPEVAALVRECFGPAARVCYEDGRPVIVRDGTPDATDVAGVVPCPGCEDSLRGAVERGADGCTFFQVQPGAPLSELERSGARPSLPHPSAIEALLPRSPGREEIRALPRLSSAEACPSSSQNRLASSVFPIEGAFLSVAHSGEMAVCALSTVPVGVDVERADREVLRLRRSFSPGERDYCRRHAEDYPSPELLIFTRKEATMKGCGRTTFRGYRELELAKNGLLAPVGAGLPLTSFLLAGYLVSVACEENLQIVEKKIFSLSPEKSGKG